jgi:hypothetical protein
MARYYLIPNETDKEKMRGMNRCPKYLDLIGTARGVTDWNNTTGKKYYLVVIEDDKQDMKKLEECSDVKKIDTTFLTKTNIESLGVSVLSTKPSQDDLEKLLVKWLTGDEKTLRLL